MDAATATSRERNDGGGSNARLLDLDNQEVTLIPQPQYSTAVSASTSPSSTVQIAVGVMRMVSRFVASDDQTRRVVRARAQRYMREHAGRWMRGPASSAREPPPPGVQGSGFSGVDRSARRYRRSSSSNNNDGVDRNDGEDCRGGSDGERNERNKRDLAKVRSIVLSQQGATVDGDDGAADDGGGAAAASPAAAREVAVRARGRRRKAAAARSAAAPPSAVLRRSRRIAEKRGARGDSGGARPSRPLASETPSSGARDTAPAARGLKAVRCCDEDGEESTISEFFRQSRGARVMNAWAAEASLREQRQSLRLRALTQGERRVADLLWRAAVADRGKDTAHVRAAVGAPPSGPFAPFDDSGSVIDEVTRGHIHPTRFCFNSDARTGRVHSINIVYGPRSRFLNACWGRVVLVLSTRHGASRRWMRDAVDSGELVRVLLYHGGIDKIIDRGPHRVLRVTRNDKYALLYRIDRHPVHPALLPVGAPPQVLYYGVRRRAALETTDGAPFAPPPSAPSSTSADATAAQASNKQAERTEEVNGAATGDAFAARADGAPSDVGASGTRAERGAQQQGPPPRRLTRSYATRSAGNQPASTTTRTHDARTVEPHTRTMMGDRNAAGAARARNVTRRTSLLSQLAAPTSSAASAQPARAPAAQPHQGLDARLDMTTTRKRDRDRTADDDADGDSDAHDAEPPAGGELPNLEGSGVSGAATFAVSPQKRARARGASDDSQGSAAAQQQQHQIAENPSLAPSARAGQASEVGRGGSTRTTTDGGDAAPVPCTSDGPPRHDSSRGAAEQQRRGAGAAVAFAICRPRAVPRLRNEDPLGLAGLALRCTDDAASDPAITSLPTIGVGMPNAIGSERFDSRHELRWSVFFKALGVQYIREFATFTFDGYRYAPDFYLPFAGVDGGPLWVELKPCMPTVEAMQRCRALAERGCDVALLYGRPGVPFAHDGAEDEYTAAECGRAMVWKRGRANMEPGFGVLAICTSPAESVAPQAGESPPDAPVRFVQVMADADGAGWDHPYIRRAVHIAYHVVPFVPRRIS